MITYQTIVSKFQGLSDPARNGLAAAYLDEHRIESPLYSPWAVTLNEEFATFPAPQPRRYSGLSSSVSPQPSYWVDSLNEEYKDSIEPDPELSFESFIPKRDESRTLQPDLAVVIHANQHVILGINTEIKKFPARKLNIDQWATQMTTRYLQAAMRQAEDQVICFFMSRGRDRTVLQSQVIAVAAAGEWFTFKCIKRESLETSIQSLSAAVFPGEPPICTFDDLFLPKNGSKRLALYGDLMDRYKEDTILDNPNVLKDVLDSYQQDILERIEVEQLATHGKVAETEREERAMSRKDRQSHANFHDTDEYKAELASLENLRAPFSETDVNRYFFLKYGYDIKKRRFSLDLDQLPWKWQSYTEWSKPVQLGTSTATRCFQLMRDTITEWIKDGSANMTPSQRQEYGLSPL